MSFMSVDGTRSATKHAGVPAIITVPFDKGTAGKLKIVEGPTDGRKVKLHSYLITAQSAGRATFATSATGDITSLTGEIVLAQGTPASQDGGFNGLGECTLDQDLIVSSVGAGVNGNVSYSLVP